MDFFASRKVKVPAKDLNGNEVTIEMTMDEVHEMNQREILFKGQTWNKYNRLAHGIQNRLYKQYYGKRRDKGESDPFLSLVALHELVVKVGKYSFKKQESRRFVLQEILFLTDTLLKDLKMKEIKGHYSVYDWSENIISDAENLITEMKVPFLSNMKIK